MLNLLSRLLKIEIVILVLLTSSIAIYAAADAIEGNSQDFYSTVKSLSLLAQATK